ncbi:hypothetical protein Tco_1435610, partial [Tanacetum coccineum]
WWYGVDEDGSGVVAAVMMVWCKVMAAAAANDEGVSNGDGDETKVMKDVMGMTMLVDLW